MLYSKTKLLSSKVIIIFITIIIIIFFLAWLFIESSKPLPGEKIADLGRGHVEIGKEIEYNSNPPTSGPHYADWVRAGIYETERDDRNLVHSLEHGYVILSVKCNSPSGARSEKLEEATESGELSGECKNRKDQLAKVYESKGKRKLIVVPREDLETNFALTAWTYLDKFDPFDEARIEKFIDAHRDQGPERTME